ncbi:DNA-directed RNA polymerase [Atopomonas hussainii]|uniref:DNA-directed RNA polymerase n=1 Tax=Atopomonas hussainii TaxID=1429083 RepID=A0A1H7SPA9_9GAMM|nr:DNA-directed RNA polymerase [Atopomonas hussainii]
MQLYSEHDVLKDFREQVLLQLDPAQLDDLPPLPSKGNLELHSVLQSKYCFA